jgi:D-alanyl-D-alanine dipeptidase
LSYCFSGCFSPPPVQRGQTQNTPARTADRCRDVLHGAFWNGQSEPTEEPAATTGVAEPDEDAFVRVLDWIPSIYVELRYATSDNFTGEVSMISPRLICGTGQSKAGRRAECASGTGYSLQKSGTPRPVSAQFKLWEIVRTRFMWQTQTPGTLSQQGKRGGCNPYGS